VVNVFRLHNTVLSEQLQRAGGGGKRGGAGTKSVKGLFCPLPPSSLYALATFGIAPPLPPNSNPPLPINLGEIFKANWFTSTSSPPPSSSERQGGEGWGDIPRGQAASLALASWSSFFAKPLRFSRYSSLSPSSRSQFSEEELEQGIFLALCRVIVLQQKTIATHHISESDIAEAIKLNYDTIYSSASEEYVLLNPKFVLPEFLMHVQFVSPSLANSNSSLSRQYSSIPAMLRANSDIGSTGINGGKRLLEHNSVWSALLSNHANSSNISISQCNNPRAALMKKQNIVMAIQESVNSFQQKRIALLREYKARIGLLKEPSSVVI
jgi:hypothetical protein